MNKNLFVSIWFSNLSIDLILMENPTLRDKPFCILRTYKKQKFISKLNNKCKPITNAVLDIWQANSFGKYNHQADLSESRKDNDFYGYMRLLSNEKGEYSFNSILPGSYKVSKNLTYQKLILL